MRLLAIGVLGLALSSWAVPVSAACDGHLTTAGTDGTVTAQGGQAPQTVVTSDKKS